MERTVLEDFFFIYVSVTFLITTKFTVWSDRFSADITCMTGIISEKKYRCKIILFFTRITRDGFIFTSKYNPMVQKNTSRVTQKLPMHIFFVLNVSTKQLSSKLSLEYHTSYVYKSINGTYESISSGFSSLSVSYHNGLFNFTIYFKVLS